MKITLINSLWEGGAALSIRRLHSAFIALGHASRLITRQYGDGAQHVTGLFPTGTPIPDSLQYELTKLDRTYPHRSDERAYFRLPNGVAGGDLVRKIGEPDILQLNWVSDNFLDFNGFFQALPPSLPIVWRLADMNPITGGCHFSGDCRRFLKTCGQCPALGSNDDRDPSSQALALKRDLLAARQGRVHFVATGRKMADLIAESSIGRGHPVSIIPNGVDLDLFAPNPRVMADPSPDSSLSRASQPLKLLMVAAHFGEERKGLSILGQALAQQQPGSIDLILAGYGAPSRLGGHNVNSPGSIAGRTDMADLYRWADVVVIPSIDDNLPNVLLEAMASGVCCIATSVGGMPDLIKHGRNGLLVPPGDPAVLAQALNDVRSNPHRRRDLGRRARAYAETHLASSIEAQAYLGLYDEMVATACAE